MRKTDVQRIRAVAFVWVGLAFLFFVGALAMFLLQDSLYGLPRADIAYIGFLVVSAICFLIAAAVYCMAKDKRAVIKQNDEREKAIAGRAGYLAFVVQTVLISVVLFLLCFMGYVNAVVMLVLLCTIMLGVGLYLALMLYYRHRM